MRRLQTARSDERMCPEASDEYRQIDQKTRGRPALNTEQHRVETSTRVAIGDRGLELVLTARCVCGWTETTRLHGEEASDE